jgi:hypothetical protein
VLTPTGQVSFPARRAARSFWQNSSSCSRFIRTLRSSSAPSETASFHLIMRPPSPLVRLGAFAIVAEERGFLKLLPCAQAHNSTTVLLRRQFAVIRPRHSPRRRYFDIGTAFQRSSRTALTGLISPFGNRAVASRHLVRAWLASRESRNRPIKDLPRREVQHALGIKNWSLLVVLR